LKNKIKNISIIVTLFLISIFLSFKFKSFIFLLLAIGVFSFLFVLIKKVNKNFLLFYFTLLTSIIFVELFLKIDFNKIFKIKKLSTDNETIISYDNFIYEKTYLGNQLKEGTYNHYKKKANSFVFNQYYEVNNNNFKINKLIKNNNNKILKASFFGGSDIFGWGLSESETLPYLFYEQNKEYNIFNYGIIGGSLNQTLEMIRNNNDYLGDLNIVVTSSYQLPRIACNRDYSFNTPSFKVVDNEIEFDGYCISSFLKLNFQLPRIAGSILNRSELIKLFNNIFSDETSDKNISIYLQIIKKIKEISNKDNKNLVFLYYGSQSILDEKIIALLIKNKIPFIDVSLNDKRFLIKHDKHFNKLANEIWLNKLNKYLIRLKP
jgi:energy-coupling factor transporter transmembrane protein EcfT